jgi:integrase
MTEFKSFLAKDLEAYLKYRDELGYTYRRIRWFFHTLDRYLEKTGARLDQLTPLFFLEFRRAIPGEPGTANLVFIMLRGFLDYLVRMDRLDHNPLLDIPPLAQNAYIPFVFSPDQIQGLLGSIEKRVRKNEPSGFLVDLAAYTALFLMARCGLRISEPPRLRVEHYRHDDLTLYIEKTKFNKDRLIPIPRDAGTRIENFMSVRGAIIPQKPPTALLSTHYGRISKGLMSKAFHQAVSDIGIHHPKQTIGNITFADPMPHGLRHSFAVNTLRKACSKGRSPENVLPVLAAYMGHTDYRYTMKYLKVLDAEHRGAWVDFCVFHRKKDNP